MSVAVKGTTVGIATDAQGKFALALPAGATTLVVSYVGYDTQEVEIKGAGTSTSPFRNPPSKWTRSS